MGRGSWRGVVGAVLLLWGCAREAEDVPPEVTGPIPEEEAPPPDTGPEEESPDPGPGPWVPLPDIGPLPPGEVSTSGACGGSEVVRLADARGEGMAQASPSGRLIVFSTDHRTYTHSVQDTRTGRTMDVRSLPQGITTDERRVVFWMGNVNAPNPLLEVDMASGTVRQPIPERVTWILSNARELGGLVLLTEGGGLWFYSWDTATAVRLAHPAGEVSPFNQVSVPSRRVLSRDAGVLVLTELSSGKRWTIGPAKGARLLPDGSAVLYLDDTSRAWGWTPEGGSVALSPQGRSATAYDLEAATRQLGANGELFFLHKDGGATLWNVRTNAVRTSGPDVVGGDLTGSGTKLGLVSRAADGTYAVSVRHVEDGSEQRLWTGPEKPYVHLNGPGTRLALSYPVPHHFDSDLRHYATTLWNLESGTEVRLTPVPTTTRHPYPPQVDFRDDSGVVHVQDWDARDALFSVDDGTLRYATSRTVTPGEGHSYEWGPGGVFYGSRGAYLGPPNGGLFAWNPRTGAETELGSGTQEVCFMGARNVFRRGLAVQEGSGDPGMLVAWNPDTGALDTLSTQAVSPACVPESTGVVFMESWVPKDYSRPSPPGHGDLVFADVERNCRQRLATQVLEYRPLRDAVIFRTADAVWRMSYPKP